MLDSGPVPGGPRSASAIARRLNNDRRHYSMRWIRASVLVLLGVAVGQPMNLVFAPLEVAAVAAAVGISALVAYDGESNWLEGALLSIVYLIVAFSFFELSRP